jgi:bifunctional non-homologous end joining protein LigD
VFFAFDLPFCDGRDLRNLTNEQRRTQLQELIANSEHDNVRFSEAFEHPPANLVASACKLGFEGVIGKRRTGRYVSARSADWIKLKCSNRQEFVIGGFTDPKGARNGVGSLILGVHTGNAGLKYAGSVGSGFSARVLSDLYEKLSAIQTKDCPFTNPSAITKNVNWVEPKLLAEVSFAEWTKDGKVRHAVFRGLRTDKPAEHIVREVPKRMRVGKIPGESPSGGPGSGMRVSNPERVIDQTTGITKLELVRYYATVAPLMLEHLAGRPVSLVRAAEGIGGQIFFQKHLDKGAITGIREMAASLNPGHQPLLEVTQVEALAAAAQMNAIEFHTWNARKDLIGKPDRMTFDLDPGDNVPWEQMQEGAQLVRTILSALELPCFLKTSGGKGLHVVVPIKRLHDWAVVEQCACIADAYPPSETEESAAEHIRAMLPA